ncbi:MAG: chorismate synthase, partial [Acidimicrobiales bacterium]
GVVAETMVALVLSGEALRKFGGDSMAELVRNYDGYLRSLHDAASASGARPDRVVPEAGDELDAGDE